MPNSPSQRVANAIRQGNVNTIKTIAGTNRLPSSALDMAISRHKQAIVEFLLKSGIRSENAVSIAVCHGASNAVLHLLARYNYSFRTPIRPNGIRPLHVSPLPRVTKYLLSAGVSPNSRNDDGWTPLMYKSYHGTYENMKNIEVLLQQPGINVNARGKATDVDQYSFPDKTTALHLVARNDEQISFRKNILKMLIDAGANVNSLDANKRNPLTSFAAEVARSPVFTAHHATMIDMLIDAGASVKNIDAFNKTAYCYLEPRIRRSVLNSRRKDTLLNRLALGNSPCRRAYLPNNLDLQDPVSLEKVNLNNAYFIWTDVINRHRIDNRGRQTKLEKHVRTVYNKSTIDRLKGGTMRSPITRRNIGPMDIVKVTNGVPKKEIARFKAMLANSNKKNNL